MNEQEKRPIIVTDEYARYIEEKKHREERARSMPASTQTFVPTDEPRPQADSLFAAGLSKLPDIEQFIIVAYYGLNYPVMTTKQVRGRIAQVYDAKLSGIDIGTRRSRATWYIAGAMGVNPVDLEKALKLNRAHQLEPEPEPESLEGKEVEDAEK